MSGLEDKMQGLTFDPSLRKKKKAASAAPKMEEAPAPAPAAPEAAPVLGTEAAPVC